MKIEKLVGLTLCMGLCVFNARADHQKDLRPGLWALTLASMWPVCRAAVCHGRSDVVKSRLGVAGRLKWKQRGC